MFLTELFDDLRFEEHVRGHHSGQTDVTLVALANNHVVGHIDYAEYQGIPHVQMIEVSERRQGYGRALVQELQKRFPDVEIDFGMLTDDGVALLKGVRFREVPQPEVIKKLERLNKIQKRLEQYGRLANELATRSDQSEAARQETMTRISDWNKLHDEERRLEQELRDAKPYHRLIVTS